MNNPPVRLLLSLLRQRPSRSGPRARLVLAAAASLAAVSVGHAQTLYWDDNGTTAGASGNGTWNTGGDLQWNTVSAGTGAVQAWTAGADAVFNATGGTGTDNIVTISGGVTANSVNFRNNSTTLNNSTLNLGAGGLITNTNAHQINSSVILLADQVFNIGGSTTSFATGNVSGAFQITKAGAGTLTFNSNGTSQFSGGLIVRTSAVITNSANGLGTGRVTLGDVDSTGGVSLRIGANTTTVANPITISGANAFSKSLGNTAANAVTFSNLVTLNGNLTLSQNGTGSVTLTGAGGAALTGAGNVNVTASTPAANNVTLGGNNAAFTGGVTISSGTLRVTNAAALSAANPVAVNSVAGATFNVNNLNQTIAGLNNGATAGSLGVVTNTGAGIRTLTLGGADAYSFSGILTATTPANLALAKAGTGTQTFTGANSYAGGTTISGGNLTLTDAGTLGLGNVSVTNPGSVLTLAAGVTNGIADSATLSLASTGATFAMLSLGGPASAVQETIGALLLGGATFPDGLYGSTASGVAALGGTADDNYFAGTGILSVTAIPEPSTYAVLLGGLALLGWRFRRRLA